MSLTATSRSIPGSLRQEVVIDGRHRLVTDEPETLGGDGSGPAPHELFPAALASCISTTLVMYARTKGWDLGEVTVDVDYDHQTTPRAFRVSIRVTGELDDAQLERLEHVARRCPVRRAIEAGVVFEEVLERTPGLAEEALLALGA
jgi:putative redox protein